MIHLISILFLNFSFFRIKAEKTAKKEGDIFDAKKEGYKPSEQRKKDQAAIDTQVSVAFSCTFTC